MKQTLTLLAGLLLTGFVFAQNPVNWTYTAKKVADKTYEIHLTATIMSGWHIYSQTQPADAINIPTEIKFNPNPLLTLDGKTREIGKMELMTDKKLGVSANQYSNKVDFVQRIKMKSAAKTTIVGTVEYQTCDDKKCLPPVKNAFSVAIK